MSDGFSTLSSFFHQPFEFFLLLLCQLGLSINHHADQSLNSFCQWQSGLMGKSGKRHDHAILLTGLDICSWKNEPCDTLGKTITILHLKRVPCFERFCIAKMLESELRNAKVGESFWLVTCVPSLPLSRVLHLTQSKIRFAGS